MVVLGIIIQVTIAVNFIKKYKFKKGLQVLDPGCADGRSSIYLMNVMDWM